MSTFLDRVLRRILINRAKSRSGKPLKESPYRFALAYRILKINLKRSIKDTLLILSAIASACFGLQGFILPNHFIDGGATGISLLTNALSGWSISVLIIFVNAPFVVLGYSFLGKKFAIKTTLAILGLSLGLSTISFPQITPDTFLASFFGGFFLGAGIGLAVRAGSVIDGTEILAIYLSRKLSASIGDVILIFNVILFSVAAYFLSVEIALYSMVTYFVASKTLDFISEGIDEYVGVTIVASKSEEIRTMITEHLGRGVTIYSGKKGYGKTGTKAEVEIIYTVITRLELNKLNTEIEKIEPTAFVVMNNVKDTRGGMIKKRPLHHG
jgi:uncharacterized membrane-anchored protein YitT (DUF2179 family)